MKTLEKYITKNIFIVAEIGKNFIRAEEERSVAEYLENAKALVKAAAYAGADAVKFQTHTAEDEVLNIDFDSPHFKGTSRYGWVLRNERATPLDDFWKPLKHYCDEIGVVFFSTPMSRGAAQILQKLDTPFWKVASSDILDFVMLDFMASTGKTIIIPTGMSTVRDIDQSLDFLKRKGASVVLMHAISRYPYPAEDSNLLTIRFLQKRYAGIPVGFSQNSPWVEPAIMAVALGACIVEQHFTFDRGLWGPDHKVSMIPEEFKKMVAGIREIEYDAAAADRVRANPAMQNYLGREEKFLQKEEEPFRAIFRKSLVAARDMAVGSIVSPSDLFAMRPQELIGGVVSEQYEAVLGRRIGHPLKKYNPIPRDILEECNS